VPRLLLLTDYELTRDPRARRAAEAGRARGLEVVGVCGTAAGDRPAPLEDVRIVRVGGDGVSAALRPHLGSARSSRPLVRELRGTYRLARLARLTLRLTAAAHSLGRFDIVHANDFPTLTAGWLIARRSGARLVYDAHEIYAAQEDGAPKGFTSAAAHTEAALARRARAVVTVSEPIARELSRRFDLARPPFVVRNCPPRTEVAREPRPSDGPLRAVYQGVLGPNRPFEDLLAACAHADGVELTVRVAGADLEALRGEVGRRGLQDRVDIVEPVRPDRLVQALTGFDVGVIFNRPVTLNQQLAMPNRLFEYMMAGLAIVCPRLPGVAPLVESEGIGMTYEPGRPEALGAALTDLAANPARAAEMGAQARQLAMERYNAEAEARVLADAWGI
jgi:glycosyltransferase involved in cell wall biosynthesis